jgi:hypothetical protein
MGTRRKETFDHTVFGLLAKRKELVEEIADLKEKVAFLGNDVEAIDRVLDTLGHNDHREGRSPRAARIILFYRNELRIFLLDHLRKSDQPMTSRELAMVVCDTEGKSPGDQRLIRDVTRRVSTTLRTLQSIRAVTSSRNALGKSVWQATQSPTHSGSGRSRAEKS